MNSMKDKLKLANTSPAPIGCTGLRLLWFLRMPPKSFGISRGGGGRGGRVNSAAVPKSIIKEREKLFAACRFVGATVC